MKLSEFIWPRVKKKTPVGTTVLFIFPFTNRFFWFPFLSQPRPFFALGKDYCLRPAQEENLSPPDVFTSELPAETNYYDLNFELNDLYRSWFVLGSSNKFLRLLEGAIYIYIYIILYYIILYYIILYYIILYYIISYHIISYYIILYYIILYI